MSLNNLLNLVYFYFSQFQEVKIDVFYKYGNYYQILHSDRWVVLSKSNKKYCGKYHIILKVLLLLPRLITESTMLNRNLKLLRSSMGMTQDEVASFLGIGRSAYSNYEDGRREPPLDVLEKFADLVGCDLATLYEEDEELVKSQLICSFRTEGLTNNDLEEIASFKKLVLSYLKMERLLNE